MKVTLIESQNSKRPITLRIEYLLTEDKTITSLIPCESVEQARYKFIDNAMTVLLLHLEDTLLFSKQNEMTRPHSEAVKKVIQFVRISSDLKRIHDCINSHHFEIIGAGKKKIVEQIFRINYLIFETYKKIHENEKRTVQNYS